jgi:hypothetical protein
LGNVARDISPVDLPLAPWEARVYRRVIAPAADLARGEYKS